MTTLTCKEGKHDVCPGQRLVSYKVPGDLDYQVNAQRCECRCHQYQLPLLQLLGKREEDQNVKDV